MWRGLGSEVSSREFRTLILGGDGNIWIRMMRGAILPAYSLSHRSEEKTEREGMDQVLSRAPLPPFTFPFPGHFVSYSLLRLIHDPQSCNTSALIPLNAFYSPPLIAMLRLLPVFYDTRDTLCMISWRALFVSFLFSLSLSLSLSLFFSLSFRTEVLSRFYTCK